MWYLWKYLIYPFLLVGVGIQYMERSPFLFINTREKVDPISNKIFNIFLKCFTISEARLFCAPILYMFTVNLPAQVYFKPPNFCKSFSCNKCRD